MPSQQDNPPADRNAFPALARPATNTRGRRRMRLCWLLVGVYAFARLCQLWADRWPTLLIVALHVVPPALFALLHGSILYRARGILVFALLCLGTGALAETLSLRTGFPFGHYRFTHVMGPRLLGLPALLVLAYLGIGYVSWVLSLLILRVSNGPALGWQRWRVPLLASSIMLAWDLAMEADWSTIDGAWLWRDGGPWFGVPLSNFAGWYLTAFLFYTAFALSRASRPRPREPCRQAAGEAPWPCMPSVPWAISCC